MKVVNDIDIKTLDLILRGGRLDMKVVENFIRTHFDANCKNICHTCPTQVRFAINRVKAFAKHNETRIKELRDGGIKR